jgi:hypothetical protein
MAAALVLTPQRVVILQVTVCMSTGGPAAAGATLPRDPAPTGERRAPALSGPWLAAQMERHLLILLSSLQPWEWAKC